MGLDRFELLELRRDDGIQTFHAREVSTARPVQVHLFANGLTAENIALLRRLDDLAPAERRRILDRGQAAGKPYVVTDRLAGFASLREWAELKAPPTVSRSQVSNRQISHGQWDKQFHQLFATPEEPTAAFAITPLRPQRIPEEVPDPDRPSPLLWMALGLIAALFFLILFMVVFVFRPK